MRRLITITCAVCFSALASTATAATELTFWSMWNEPEPQAQALTQVMDAYTAKNPDITFKVVWNGRQNQVKIRGALQAGTKIDFMDQDGDQLSGGLVKAGLGEPLNDLLDSGIKDNLLPQVLDQFTFDDKIYQLPYIYNPISFWYSKQMLDELKVEAPKTIDELLSVCGTASDAGFNFLVTEGNVGDYQLFHFSYMMQRIAGPGSLLAASEDKSGESWRSESVAKALAAEQSLVDAKCFPGDVAGYQFPIGQQSIALGLAAAELVGAWLPAELSKAVEKDFEWGSFAFPSVEGGTGTMTDLQASLLTMMVFKDSPNKAQALDFLTFLMSDEGQTIIGTEGNVGVTNKNIPWNGTIKDGYDLALSATTIMSVNDATNVFYPEYHSTVLNPTHSEFFLGSLSADEFIEAMVERSKEFWSNK